MPRPLVALISSHALQHNLDVLRAKAHQADVWAVVKANAYGHGLVRAMHAFAAADGLALVEPEGAVLLRKENWRKPILLLEGFFDMSDLLQAAALNLDCTVHADWQLTLIESARLSQPISVHLKINSGMNRLGFTATETAEAYRRLSTSKNVREIKFITHFANADQPDMPALTVERQHQNFLKAIAGLSGKVTLANSALSIFDPSMRADGIRPGIALYGASPSETPAADLGLLPAMTLCSTLIAVQHIVAGQAVGYGSQYVASAPMNVGVVACGYADGYPRTAPLGTPILVDGVKCPLIGRVSMDMLTVDITRVPRAGTGSRVVLWGAGLPVDTVAQACGTIGYELLTAITPRVPLVDASESV